jgi:hypothetical protein
MDAIFAPGDKMKRARLLAQRINDDNNVCFEFSDEYKDNNNWQAFQNRNTTDRNQGKMRKNCIHSASRSMGWHRCPIKILVARIKDQGDYIPSGDTPIEVCICWQLLSILNKDAGNIN